jgi:hypothetical protein
MEATRFSERSVDFQWTTWPYVPEDRTLDYSFFLVTIIFERNRNFCHLGFRLQEEKEGCDVTFFSPIFKGSACHFLYVPCFGHVNACSVSSHSLRTEFHLLDIRLILLSDVYTSHLSFSQLVATSVIFYLNEN